MVQLQRQSSAIGAGLPSLQSGTTPSAFPVTQQPGLSAFLTSSDPLDDYSASSGSKQGDSNTHNFGLGSFSSSSSSLPTSAVSQQQHSQHYQQVGAGSLTSSGQQQHLSTGSEIHPLHCNWVFWFMHRAPGSRILNYESAMKRIASFGSVSATR